MRPSLLVASLLWAAATGAQSYTSWFTGNATDAQAEPLGGACLMGGASENDEAMRWFLQRAGGGDVLVLRATGSNGYNNYFYSALGVPLNSVETIRFNSPAAANDPYVHERIQRAEAIWFAGGDQWTYVSYWRDTPVMTLINEAIDQRGIAIGGTSAGMAILGGMYFAAQNGTVTSATALANPYHPAVTVQNQPFLQVPWLGEVITDTHYDAPDRRGRHMVFLARAITDWGVEAKGIACNEYTAVCIAPDGTARVYGEWPQYPEYAYFVQANCLFPQGPEACAPGSPLTWHHGGQAVKACRVPGTMQGSNTFSLADWRTTSGGEWQHWSASGGVFSATPGEVASDCDTGWDEGPASAPRLRPDGSGHGWLICGMPGLDHLQVVDATGRRLPARVERTPEGARFSLHAGPPRLAVAIADAPGRRAVFRIVLP
ncbi:MAG: cyanophycinase [Flavobacteriales bacterium]